MTATCVFCGTLFEALPDLSVIDPALRSQKQFADIGRMGAAHFAQNHRKTAQQSIDDPNLVGPLPIPAFIGAIGMCAQNATINAHLVSEDAVFQGLKQKMVDLVVKGMEQVKPAPAISLV